MAHLIFDQGTGLAAWAAAKLPYVGPQGFGPCAAIGAASGPLLSDQLLAVIVYHDYLPGIGTMQCSLVATSPKWATPGTIQAFLFYPFQQAGVRKLWVAIVHTNERAIRFGRGLGFKREATLRQHFSPRHHAVIMSMLAEEYQASRWFVPPLAERKAA